MQRNPEELYELGPAAPGIAGAPMLHYLEGFIDAGTAGRLLTEHLLRVFPHETVARFDTDRLIDYRSRRPLMTYDNSRWESYEPPELALHLLHDQGERPFLLLTGPEPDHEWDLFSRAVLAITSRLDTGPAISFLGIPAGMPHTRPLGVIAHATREDLLAGHQRLPSRIQVPGSAPALLELRLGEAGRDALGFAVQVPHYLAQAEYPAAASMNSFSRSARSTSWSWKTPPTEGIRRSSGWMRRRLWWRDLCHGSGKNTCTPASEPAGTTRPAFRVGKVNRTRSWRRPGSSSCQPGAGAGESTGSRRSGSIAAKSRS